MNELAIMEGISAIEILGIANLDEIHKVLDAELEIYKNYLVTEESQVTDKAILEKLKELRKPVKSLRARLNKELKAKTETELKKIDDITAKLDSVIKPIEEGIERFAEERKQENLQRKNQKFKKILDEINETIKSVNLPYLMLEEISIHEDWANWSEQKLLDAIDRMTKERYGIIKHAKNRIEQMQIYAEGIKEQYMLRAEMDIYFKGEIYTKEIEELEAMIEEKAVEQSKIEHEVKEQIQQEKNISKEEVKEIKLDGMKIDNFKLEIINCPREKTKALKNWLDDNGISYKLEFGK